MTTKEIHGPHGHDFTSVAACLSRFKTERLVFVHNPGNAGDNIINLGIYRLFDTLGLDYDVGRHTEIYRDRIIVYSGGGSLVPHYPSSDVFFRKNHPVCKALILLPHTVRAHGDMIADMDERCHVFAREQASYDFIAMHATRANIYLSHDMAFMLDAPYVQGLHWDWGDIARRGHLRAWVTMLCKFFLVAKLHSPTLSSMRIDREARDRPIETLNFDMSQMYATADMNRAACANVAKALKFTLQAFHRVETDRLHIAIFSAILGSDVRMLDNNYGKNSAIFDHSMRGRFDNVRFTSTEILGASG